MSEEVKILAKKDALKDKLKMMITLLSQGLEDEETIKYNIDEYIETYWKDFEQQLQAKTLECEVLKDDLEISNNNCNARQIMLDRAYDNSKKIVDLQQENAKLLEALSVAEDALQNIYDNEMHEIDAVYEITCEADGALQAIDNIKQALEEISDE